MVCARSRLLPRLALHVMALAGLFWLVAATSHAHAAELLMFEEQGCPWCRRWHAEVGIGYPKTPEGRRAPLHRLDIHGPKPDGVVLASPVRATPTFVLIENGREIGRITGYPGADFFWGLLNGLIEKLENSTPVATHEGDSAAAAALPKGL